MSPAERYTVNSPTKKKMPKASRLETLNALAPTFEVLFLTACDPYCCLYPLYVTVFSGACPRRHCHRCLCRSWEIAVGGPSAAADPCPALKMNSRATLKRRLLRQLESDIDRFLPDSRHMNELGRIARYAMLNVIMESLPQFPSELRPPALRRGDYYDEIALAIIECPDPPFLRDERIRFSLYRVLRVAGAQQQTLLQRAVDSSTNGDQLFTHFSANLQHMLELPVAVIPPNDLDWTD